MPKPEILTVKDAIYWTYANIGMAQSAIDDGSETYQKKHFMIRSRLFYGLLQGKLKLSTLATDEKLKLTLPNCCSYCGATEDLSVDHLTPQSKGGKDSGDNFVWACRSCNSSKGAIDLLAWYKKKDEFPPLLLLRRYLKLGILDCEEAGILDKKLEEVDKTLISVKELPRVFPKPNQLCLFVKPLNSSAIT